MSICDILAGGSLALPLENSVSDYTSCSDSDLIRSMQDGEALGIETIIQRYETRLIAYAARYVDSADLAKDVCQEVFLKLVHRPPVDLPGGSLGPWLYRVTRNLAIDKRRRRKFEIIVDPADLSPADAEESPAALASASTDKELVKRLVDQLPVEFRDVVYLRMYADLSFKEVAESLSIPQGTALWRMHRAVELLRTLWNSHAR